MSTMSLAHLPRLSLPQMSVRLKVSVVGVSLGIALIGALAMVLKRKRNKPAPQQRGLARRDYKSARNEYTNHMTGNKLQRMPPSKSPVHGKSPNGG